MNIEPVTQKQVNSLINAVGRFGATIGGLLDVDLSKGRGVLDHGENEQFSHCLWTKDRRRISVSICHDGATIVSCAKQPDPECP